jgi:uncharacterized membrane protein YidH (DUF202 family)
MSPKTMVAMLLIVLGVAAIAYGGLNRSREQAIDRGDVQVAAERSQPITLPPIAGILAIGGGIILFVFDVRKLVPAGARS